MTDLPACHGITIDNISVLLKSTRMYKVTDHDLK